MSNEENKKSLIQPKFSFGFGTLGFVTLDDFDWTELLDEVLFL